MLRILNIISGILAVFGLVLIVTGLQDCSGDGCMVRLLLFLGLPVFILTAPVFYFTRKWLKE